MSMENVAWNREDLARLKEYYESDMAEAEDALGESSYPPDEQKRIDIDQHCIWLIAAMMSEKSWEYKAFNGSYKKNENENEK